MQRRFASSAARALGVPGLLLVLLLSAAVVQASGSYPPTPPPLGVPNQSPLALALLPFSPAPAWLGPPGSQGLRLSTAYSSVFVRQSSSRSSLNLDMELFYLALRYDYVPRRGLQLGVEAPFLVYWGGFLDSFIEGYHRALGLPNGGREQVPRDLVRYRASQPGRTLINRSSSTQGLGDLRLFGQMALIEDRPAQRALSLLAQASLPSGDQDRGLGAGRPGLGLGLAFDQGWGRLSLNANLMGFYLQDATLLAPLEVQNVLAGSVSLGWAWSPVLTLMGQINGSTPLFASTGVQGLATACCNCCWACNTPGARTAVYCYPWPRT